MTRTTQTNQDAPADTQLREDETLTDLFRQWGAFIRRRRKEILLGMLAGAILAGWMVTRLQEEYETDTLLMVTPPSQSPIETEAAAAAAAEIFVEGQVYIIESTSVLSDVVRRLNLTEEPFYQPEPDGWVSRQVARLSAVLGSDAAEAAPLDPDLVRLTPEEAHAVRALRGSIDVSREGDTEIIRISATADSATLAARVADAVAESYVRNRETAQFNQASRVAEWLDERALTLQGQLSRAEDAVAAYRIANNLVSGEPGTTLSEQQLTELNTELIATRTALAERRAAHARVSEVLASGGPIQSLPELQASDVFVEMWSRLLVLERRESELGGGAANNPRLDAVREERATIEVQLDAEVRRILELIANEVETLEARESLIVEALVAAGGETGEASLSSVELRDLQRRADAYSDLYERYLANDGLVEESISFLSSGVEMIDMAEIPTGAKFPSPKAIILFGLVFGAVAGGGIAFIREATLPGFMTVRQLEAVLNVPVLASVPQLEGGRSAAETLNDLPMSPYAEAIRGLRHEVMSARTEGRAPIVLMTSSVADEGKTTLASALAESARDAELSVLLVDADLRQAGLTRLFEAEDSTGLAELLRARKWAFFDPTPGRGQLDFMPAGAPVNSPGDLLSGQALADYLEEARSHYDLILIDGPPVANMSDACLLTRLSDTVGFVVRWNDTPRDVASEAVKRLLRETDSLGIAFNGVNLEEVARYGERYSQYVLSTRGTDYGVRATT